MLKMVKSYKRCYCQKPYAWKELDLNICRNVNLPINVSDDPKWTLKKGEELKLTKYMCQLIDNDNRQEYPENFTNKYSKPISGGFNAPLDKNYILHPDEITNFIHTVANNSE